MIPTSVQTEARTYTGFDKLMPEGRRAPWKFLPRPGARLSVTFGAPLSPAAVRATMGSGTELGLGQWHDGEVGQVKGEVDADAEAEAEVKVRIALTELVQRAVEGLGRQVSGDLLNGSLPHHHQQRT
jgi:monolysocardiolipin acyltransferase